MGLSIALAVLTVASVPSASLAQATADETGLSAAGQEPSVWTKASGGSYDVYVNDTRITSIAVRDAAYTVRTTISGDGRRVAAIPDHDGTHGSRLVIVDTRSGDTHTADTGRISSAAFAADGSTIAYTVAGDGASEVRVGDGRNGFDRMGSIDGRDVEVLGWDDDERSLYLVRRPNAESDAVYAATLTRMDLGTGAHDDLVTSDPAKGIVYGDFRLVRVDDVQHLSFVRTGHVYVCGGGKSSLVLATSAGDTVREYGGTADTYRRAVWSDDGRRVAFEYQACAAKTEAAETKEELARLERESGLYIADFVTGEQRPIMTGLSSEYRLSGLEADNVRLESTRKGAHQILITDSESTVQASTLDSEAPAPMARRNWAQYMHQLWDTRNEFDGRWSCGPTSAVIGVAGYQLPQWGTNVSSPWAHWSPYGMYVSNTFSYAGSTFNRSMPDASGRWWTGSHGWILESSCYCAGWAREADFIRRHTGSVWQTMADPAWVRARINEGKLVVVSGNFVWGRYGHLSVITGYTDDGRFYVHDTYGNGTDGSYDGANSVYTWDYIQPKQFWAF